MVKTKLSDEDKKRLRKCHSLEEIIELVIEFLCAGAEKAAQELPP